MHGRCCLGESCLHWGSDQSCWRIWGCLKTHHSTESSAPPQPFPRLLPSSHLLGIHHGALLSAYPSVGLARPMSPLCVTWSPTAQPCSPPISFSGGPTSCCQPKPQQHHKLVTTLPHLTPSGPPAPQQPSLPGFTTHTCIPILIKAYKNQPLPAGLLCPEQGDGEGKAWPVGLGLGLTVRADPSSWPWCCQAETG